MMMSSLLSVHPTDETISRLADQDEVARMRSRAGRHVSRCERCGALMREYWSLGEAARGLPAEELPPLALRARIAAASEQSSAQADPSSATPVGTPASLRQPTSLRPVVRRRLLAGIAAGVGLVALLWPVLSHHDLAAADTQRLTLLPRYPLPGSQVRVRFAPPVDLPPADTLWLEGELRVTDGRSNEGSDDVTLGAPLVRVGAEYRGSLALPPNAVAGTIHVVHGRWPRIGQRRLADAILLTAAPTGDRPSLDALEALADAMSGERQGELLAGEFRRWAPDHPLRWTVQHAAVRQETVDWFGFFASSERRFARLTRAMSDRKAPRAGELAGMALLAYDIEEPGLAAEWTDRLIAEHPESGWSFEMRARQVHAMELRSAPRDSIEMLARSLTGLIDHAPRSPNNPWALRGVIERSGDSVLMRRWTLHFAHRGLGGGGDLVGRRDALRDPAVRDSVEAGARATLAATAGSRSPGITVSRAFAYGQLASVALARSEYLRAIALTDSTHLGACRWIGQDTRGLAYLALGDTASAMRHLLPYAKGEWSGADSVRRVLGRHATGSDWTAAVDSAWRDGNECRAREDAVR